MYGGRVEYYNVFLLNDKFDFIIEFEFLNIFYILVEGFIDIIVVYLVFFNVYVSR